MEIDQEDEVSLHDPDASVVSEDEQMEQTGKEANNHVVMDDFSTVTILSGCSAIWWYNLLYVI